MAERDWLGQVKVLNLTKKSLTSIPKTIGKMQSLHCLFFFFVFADSASCRFAGDFTKLIEVDLSHNPLNDSHAEEICDLLKHTTSLKSLE